MKTIIFVFCIISVAGVLTFDKVDAELLETKPTMVCDYVSAVGLPTRGWKNYGDNEWGCTSNYKEIGSSGPTWAPGLRNNLAYYCSGTASPPGIIQDTAELI
ncbi:MAG: hypothetical protein ACOWWM_19405 [Desulfobacterales bacterium]